ncbi:hypothetical protein [Paenibacillus sp. KS-LC4]|uniref:hypothetical protein n=1 Tax=Paenibacillus sp. KS-LC4 TaxID=2979727 RepID=UPI0030D5184F
MIDDEEQILLRDVVYAKNAIGLWYTYSWCQRELLALFDLFLSLCIPIETIAASCFEFSIEFGNTYLHNKNALTSTLNGGGFFI